MALTLASPIAAIAIGLARLVSRDTARLSDRYVTKHSFFKFCTSICKVTAIFFAPGHRKDSQWRIDTIRRPMKNRFNISLSNDSATCSLCQDTLLRHISHNKVFWYCPSCRQEMVCEERPQQPVQQRPTLKQPALTPHLDQVEPLPLTQPPATNGRQRADIRAS